MGYVVFLGGKVRWHLTIKDSSSLTLKSLPGFSFLNPLKHLDFFFEHGLLGYKHVTFNDHYFIETRGFALKLLKPGKIDSEAVLEEMKSIFRSLKATSLQFDMDFQDFMMAYPVQSLNEKGRLKDGLSSKSILDLATLPKGTEVQRNLMAIFCSWKELSLADKMVLKKAKVSISDEIIMDAKAAILSGDYRKSMLYSSIACDSLISNTLIDRYSELRSKKKLKFEFKPDPRNSLDPVYEQLSKADNFSNKIHALSLYLLNKSLLIDNKQLYDAMLKVYSTRNKIAHLGEVPHEYETKLLKIDRHGALYAFENALQFFAWLGKGIQNEKLTFARPFFVDPESLSAKF